MNVFAAHGEMHALIAVEVFAAEESSGGKEREGVGEVAADWRRPVAAKRTKKAEKTTED